MKTHTLTLTEEQIDKYGLRELVPFTGWAKLKLGSNSLLYYENNILKYGINIYDEWFVESREIEYMGKNKRPATPEEVEKGLIEMAKKMGFKEGVKTIHGVIKNNYRHEYVNSENWLYFYDTVIFENGKWATIIPDAKKMTIEEIQKELGYKIKIVE